MKIAFAFGAVLVIVAAIIFGPLATDAIRDDRSEIDRHMEDLEKAVERYEDASEQLR